MSKKTRNVILIVVGALLLVAISVGSTLAYLKASATVTNVFVVGKINPYTPDPEEGDPDYPEDEPQPAEGAYLDETPVDEYGVPVEGATERVTENTYTMLPGNTYVKDPTVHVGPGSEKCYVFVKITNTCESITGAVTPVSGWTVLDKDKCPGVYYQVVDTSETNTNLVVFEQFTVSADVTAEDLAAVDGEDSGITVDAYLIQYAKFEDSVLGAYCAASGTTIDE